MGARDRLAEARNVLYLCDGRACENPDNCRHNGTGECLHTTRIEHALHENFDLNDFVPLPSRSGEGVDLWEPTDG